MPYTWSVLRWKLTGKPSFFGATRSPGDLPQALVLAALDVAGAPSRVAALVRPGQRVIVLGAGGTAGLLTLCALRQQLGSNGEIIAIEYSEKAVADILDLGVSDVVVRGDATRTMATSFTEAALGAEGMARQVEMHIGNGYMPDHGAVALQLLRDYPTLRTIFDKRFG